MDQARQNRVGSPNALAAACLVAVALAAALGCGGYGEVSRPAYDYATALYAVCNQKSTERLSRIAEQIEQAAAAGTLPARESKWLAAIIGDARSGDWEDAAAQCRRIMLDQTSG